MLFYVFIEDFRGKNSQIYEMHDCLIYSLRLI